MTNSHYVVKVGQEDKERLSIQHQTLAEGTESFLKKINLTHGMKVLVVGCGAGDETVLIANKIGPKGEVTAIDINKDQVKVAQERMALEKLNNVKIEALAINDLDKISEQFDIVYCRMVLVHVPDPIKALNKMLLHVKTHGVLACEEPDISSCFTAPKSFAFDQHINLLCEFLKRNGCDPDLGSKTYNLFKKIGLSEVKINFSQSAITDRNQKLATLLSAKNCGPQYIAAQLATKDEVERMIISIEKEVINNEDLVIGQCRMAQVSGIKIN